MQDGTNHPPIAGSATAPTALPAHDALVHRLLTWGVFVVIVLGGAFVVATHPVEYATSGAVVFIGAETPAEREGRTEQPVDPSTQSVLARFGSTTVVADMMARTYQSPAKIKELREQGMQGRLIVTTKTSITSETPDHGPVMVFSVFGASPESTRDDVKLAMDDLPKELAKWQQGSDPNMSVSVATVLGPKDGVLESGSKPRAAVAIVAAAALIGWSLGQIHLEVTRRLQRRRQRASVPTVGGSAPVYSRG